MINNNFFSNHINYYHTIVIALILVTFSSCGEHNSSTNKSVFRYNESSGIISLDPAFSRDQAHIWVCNQLYNSLVKLDDNNNIIPSVASSWDISNDGRTYSFHLRNDVYFNEDSCFKGVTRKVKSSDFAVISASRKA